MGFHPLLSYLSKKNDPYQVAVFLFYGPFIIINGGEGGIRTHGGLTTTAVFKTAALNHSTTSPGDNKHCITKTKA